MGRTQAIVGSGGSPALTLLSGGRTPALKPAEFGTRASLLTLALDAMAEAALFVGRGGQIVYANRAAQMLLDDADVLCRVRDHVEAADPAQRALLAAIIADVASAGATGALSLIGDGGERVNLTALPGEASGPAQVLLLAARMRRGEGQIVAQLQQAFGLTVAEADVARCLSAGDTPAEIAKARGASLGTVHCQIKMVAAKLGCRRQTEIAAIVQAMPRIHGEPARPAALSIAI